MEKNKIKEKIKAKLNNCFEQFKKDNFFDSVMKLISINQIKGDYLEFGVWEGESFISAYKQAEKHNLLDRMRFFAFDSFQGLPSVKGIDDDGYFKKGKHCCSKEKFLHNLIFRGVKLDDSHIVEGWYDKVLNDDLKKRLNIKKVAGVYVDCDLYESTILVLNFITDLVQDGAFIIFDDWFCFKGRRDRGEQKAFYEWLNKNKKFKATEYQNFKYGGKSFIINLT